MIVVQRLNITAGHGTLVQIRTRPKLTQPWMRTETCQVAIGVAVTTTSAQLAVVYTLRESSHWMGYQDNECAACCPRRLGVNGPVMSKDEWSSTTTHAQLAVVYTLRESSHWMGYQDNECAACCPRRLGVNGPVMSKDEWSSTTTHAQLAAVCILRELWNTSWPCL
jgi:hypothetical protein